MQVVGSFPLIAHPKHGMKLDMCKAKRMRGACQNSRSVLKGIGGAVVACPTGDSQGRLCWHVT